MKSITIPEAKKAKQALEGIIKEALMSFEIETGMAVSDISVSRLPIRNQGEIAEGTYLGCVSLKVQVV